MLGEDLLLEIDTTIDRLIENAEAMEGKELSALEESLLKKTQESLLARMLHADEKLAEKRSSLKKPHPKIARYQIQKKLFRFTKLNGDFVKNLPAKMGVRKRVRRKKACQETSS
ncbi:MAG: hypothetical protein AAGI90_04245 [Chlamydiota bacterium]